MELLSHEELDAIVARSNVRIMVPANQKGGVSKSMLGLLTSEWLAYRGLRVLLIDGDGQTNITQAMIDVEIRPELRAGFDIPDIPDADYEEKRREYEEAGVPFLMKKKSTVLDLFELSTELPQLFPRPTKLTQHIQEVEGYRKGGKVDIVAGHPALLEEIDAKRLDASHMRSIVDNARMLFWDEAIKDLYDVIIFDVPPSTTLPFRLAKSIATDVLVPNRPHGTEYRSHRMMTGAIDDENYTRTEENFPLINKLGVLPTQVDSRERRSLQEFYQDINPDLLFDIYNRDFNKKLVLPRLTVFEERFAGHHPTIIGLKDSKRTEKAKQFMQVYGAMIERALFLGE